MTTLSVGTRDLYIGNGEKYALIALPRLALDSFNLPKAEEFSDGLWFARTLPFDLQPHWREWIGTVRAEQLKGSQLILLAKSASAAPSLLDGENKRLLGLVGRFYQGLQIAAPLWVDGEVVQLTGSNVDGTVSVRQIANLTPPATTHHGRSALIGLDSLRMGAQLVPILNGFPSGEFLRLCRVLNAFFFGIREDDLRERLHQFTRCIEGLIFADPGQTTRQFKSRTELFLGPRNHKLSEALYVNRSAAEHMNDPVLSSTIEELRQSEYMELVLLAEAIARYCLTRILLKPSLLRYFQTESTGAQFWSLDWTERQQQWGEVMDIGRERSAFQARW